MRFISKINEQTFSPPIATDDMYKTVLFESKYIKPASEYQVVYSIAGYMDNQKATIRL